MFKLRLQKTTKNPRNNRPVPRRRLDDYSSHNDNLKNSPSSVIKTDRRSFRRNQTITGSLSSNFKSAGEKSGLMQSPRATEHHLRRKQRSIVSRLFAVIVISLLLFTLLYQYIANVEVALYGQTTPKMDDLTAYQKITNQYFTDHPLERFRFMLNRQNLTEFMSSGAASEVQDVVDIKASSLGSALITIKMREPIASWNINDSAEFVDGSGIIFKKNYYEKPRVTIIDESGVKSQQVKTIASARFLQFVGLGVGLAADQKLNVSKVVIPRSTTRQVQFELTDKTRLKLSVDRPVGEQVEDAARANKYLKSKNFKPVYIDVRVSGKAFYKK